MAPTPSPLDSTQCKAFIVALRLLWPPNKRFTWEAFRAAYKAAGGQVEFKDGTLRRYWSYYLSPKPRSSDDARHAAAMEMIKNCGGAQGYLSWFEKGLATTVANNPQDEEVQVADDCEEEPAIAHDTDGLRVNGREARLKEWSNYLRRREANVNEMMNKLYTDNELRERELEKRKQDLEDWEQSLEDREQDLHEREQNLEDQEQDLHEREQYLEKRESKVKKREQKLAKRA